MLQGEGKLRFKTSTALWLDALIGKARGVLILGENPESEFLKLSGADFTILLATTTASLVSNL